jgi:DNA-binding transcriptional ArsR family regulator
LAKIMGRSVFVGDADPSLLRLTPPIEEVEANPDRELAGATRITPQTASTHLAKLTQAGLLAVVRNGRHRYFRLASPTVVDMIDGIVAVDLQKRPRYRPLSGQARALSAARICYDHLAGRLSVDLTDSFIAREYVVLDDDEAAEITKVGMRVFTEFGIELPTRRSARRRFCRLCLDWTERRPHIPGAIGAAMTKRYFDLGWMERMKRSHAVIVTPLGRRGLLETFGIDASAPDDRRKHWSPLRNSPPRPGVEHRCCRTLRSSSKCSSTRQTVSHVRMRL